MIVVLSWSLLAAGILIIVDFGIAAYVISGDRSGSGHYAMSDVCNNCGARHQVNAGVPA